MARFEVVFTVYESKEPGKAWRGSSLLQNIRTIVEANHEGQARALIEAQYAGLAQVYSVRRQS